MFCPKCGKINPDDKEMCSGCGAELHTQVQAVVPAKNNNALKITFAIIAVLIVIFIAVMILNGCGNMEVPPEKMTF